VGDTTHTFDSFECTIHAVAPSCGHCGCGSSGTAGRGFLTYWVIQPEQIAVLFDLTWAG
jgi:hypothetical protein